MSGYTHALRDNDIRHIFNSYGEKTNEKYPVTAEDVELIPYIVEKYDKVFVKTNAKGEIGLVYVKVSPIGITYYLEAVTTKYGNETLLVNKQMIKTGIDDLPNLYGLKAAINKKQSDAEFLADLKKVHKAYAQSVYQNHSKHSISQSSENVKK